MKMTVTIRVESDDGKFGQESVSGVGVDTRLQGIDPDVAKEDFLDQARGLLSSVGDTHVPALYAAVQQQVDAGEPEEAEAPEEAGEPEEQPSEAARKVADKLRQIRELRQAAGDLAAEEAE